MPTTTAARPAAEPDTTPDAPTSLVSSVELHAFTPSLFVLRASFPGRNGITEHLSLTTPAAPYGTAPWQTAALALYLAAVRAGQEQLSGAALRDFLNPNRRTAEGLPHPARLPFPGAAIEYPHNVLRDRRVTCVVDAAIGVPDATGWPQVDLFVWEREEGRTRYCGFNRTIRHAGARAVMAAAHQGMEAEHHRAASRVARTGAAAAATGLAEAAALADRVAKACGAAREQARSDAAAVDEQARAATQKKGAGRVRRAMRLPLGAPEHGEQVPARSVAEMVTGVVARPVEYQEVKGRWPVARLQIAVDPQGSPRDGAPLPELLICSLEGAVAEAAHQRLQPGSRVVASGRRRVRTYRGSDEIPRSALFMEIERIGLDLIQS